MGDWTKDLSRFIGLIMVGAVIGLLAIVALIIIGIAWLL